ncbi:MAG: hypothetical protein M3115_06715 [Thermoproteota archaeon]|nr:hypothetical protein [Thermoproteota archaeon]
MISRNYNNKKPVVATLALMLLSLSVMTSIATPQYASAQGLLEGLEREQSDEALPGDQPADIGGAAPLNATTTIEEGAAGNATNATMTGGAAGNATNATMTGGAAGNATNAGDNVTTAVGDNQTGSSPLDAITDPIQDLFGGGGGGQ